MLPVLLVCVSSPVVVIWPAKVKMSLTDRCVRGSQFIGFYQGSQICQFKQGCDKKKFPKWNNFTTGNSQLGGGRSAHVSVFYILTRPE